tara:strand:+ start:315 stop:629 length:315 start_codon:yes stop_codon:yes gene_type:complete
MSTKNKAIEDIRFEIENLLSADNLMKPDSVKSLQNKLNRYVAGWPKIREDGILGSQTTKLINQYRNESRYWEGSMNITIDPRDVEKNYRKHLENPELTPPGVIR